MRKYLYLAVGAFAAVAFWSCKDDKPKQSILEGTLDLLCDESLVPIIEDQVAVFESDYRAKIKIAPKSETEIINLLQKDSGRVAILSRSLSKREIDYFKQKKIFPRITQFAQDAVVFIRSKSAQDTLVKLEDVIAFVQGKSVPSIKGLVFDNLNSGTYRYIADLAGIKAVPESGIFSFTNNKEAMEYVAKTPGMVGVIGYNWLTQPEPEMAALVSELSVLSIKGEESTYYAPTQNNLGEGKYPLARNLFLVNCQGAEGLGMGFASFIAGERGQRIVLKSGLLPVRIPSRKIVIRNTVQ